MIRDVALGGNREFGSDVDFVVKPRDVEQFHSFMTLQSAKRNRFGGYVWNGLHWRIDVWPLQNTWAHKEGHVEIRFFQDLLKATFFDCDAIIYDLQSKSLSAKPGYFERLKHRVFEINLLPNPNPIGNAVRALRYAAIRDFGWGPKLAKFMADVIEERGWQDLQVREMSSFGTRYIAEMDRERISSELGDHLRAKKHEPFGISEWCRLRQSELDFGSAGRARETNVKS